MPHTTSSEMQIGTSQLYHLGPFACSRERTKPDMKDVPYRVLLESLSWTQAEGWRVPRCLAEKFTGSAGRR
jgi:hypothetical protein